MDSEGGNICNNNVIIKSLFHKDNISRVERKTIVTQTYF